MNIEEAVSRVALAPERTVLVAKPPLTWGAEAMYVELTDDFQVPSSVAEAGYVYLVGRDDITKLIDFLKGKRVSSRSAAEFIIHYAMNDVTPAWINDVPDA